MCTDLTCALCSVSPGACALPQDTQGDCDQPTYLLTCWRLSSGEMSGGCDWRSALSYDVLHPVTAARSVLHAWDEARGEWAPLSAGENCDTGTCAPDGDCGEYTPWSRRAAPPEVSAHMVYACILAFHRANRVSTRSPWHLQHCISTARAHLDVWGGASLAACRKWGRVNARLQTRDTDPGEAGAGGDCGEHTDDTPAMPLAECAQVCWRAVMAARTSSVQSWCMPYGMGDGRTWNKRWRVARFRKWGRVNAPRWTSRHPHPLATV